MPSDSVLRQMVTQLLGRSKRRRKDVVARTQEHDHRRKAKALAHAVVMQQMESSLTGVGLLKKMESTGNRSWKSWLHDEDDNVAD